MREIRMQISNLIIVVGALALPGHSGAAWGPKFKASAGLSNNAALTRKPGYGSAWQRYLTKAARH
jgi:hypothetical protein